MHVLSRLKNGTRRDSLKPFRGGLPCPQMGDQRFEIRMGATGLLRRDALHLINEIWIGNFLKLRFVAPTSCRSRLEVRPAETRPGEGRSAEVRPASSQFFGPTALSTFFLTCRSRTGCIQRVELAPYQVLWPPSQRPPRWVGCTAAIAVARLRLVSRIGPGEGFARPNVG
jgi:hypothetical protein